MPLYRRVPKRGFKPYRREEIQIVNLASLAQLDETEIGLEQLKARRLIGSTNKRVKVLGQGSLDRAITVRAHAFSASAVQKIEAVGGRAELIG
jgi:large subunit ribosomal protein L15